MAYEYGKEAGLEQEERSGGGRDPWQPFDMYSASQSQLASHYGISSELSEFLPTYAEEYGQREELLGRRETAGRQGLYAGAEATAGGLMAGTGTSLFDLAEQERGMVAQRGMKTGRRSGQAGNIYNQYMASMQGAASQRTGGLQEMGFAGEEERLGYESGFRSNLFDMMLRIKEKEED
jgi:hypothetical protein